MINSIQTKQEGIQNTWEQACAFGEKSTLTGVYTPAVDLENAKPCAIYLTAGLLHHVGPSRLHVELARTLSAEGVAGLRFDLSGAGDSETSSLGGYFIDRSVLEIRQAMNYLESQFGHQQFVLIGLCSGADDALAAAQKDSRVVGVVLLNGYAYKAGKFFVNRVRKFYLPRLFMWKKLRNRLSSLLVRESKIDMTNRSELVELDDDFRYIPPQQETADVLATLSAEKTDLLFIYTGSEHDVYTYEGQLYAMFPTMRESPYVSEHYLQEADHTLILKSDRDTVIRWVCAWFGKAQFSRISS